MLVENALHVTEKRPRHFPERQRPHLVHVDHARDLEERVVGHVRYGSPVARVDVERLRQTGPHGFDDVGCVIGPGVCQEILDRTPAVGDSLHVVPALPHPVAPHLHVPLPDRERILLPEVATLEEGQVLLGVAHAHRHVTDGVAELPLDLAHQGAAAAFPGKDARLPRGSPDVVPDAGQQVFAPVCHFQQPVEVVHAAGSNPHVRTECRRHAVCGRHKSRPDDQTVVEMRVVGAVADCHRPQAREMAHHSDSHRGRRVDPVDDPRLGAQGADVLEDSLLARHFPQRAHRSARTDRVGGTHHHAVPGADRRVDAAQFDPFIGERQDHEVGSGQRPSSIRRGFQPKRDATGLDGAPGDLLHPTQSPLVDVYEDERAGREGVLRDHAPDRLTAEEGASRPDEDDLRTFHVQFLPRPCCLRRRTMRAGAAMAAGPCDISG